MSISVFRQACIYVCVAYACMPMASSICAHTSSVGLAGILAGWGLCEDVRARQTESLCQAPRPHQDLREALEGRLFRDWRVGKAQVYWDKTSSLLRDFRSPGPLSALHLGKGFPPSPLIPYHEPCRYVPAFLPHWGGGWQLAGEGGKG